MRNFGIAALLGAVLLALIAGGIGFALGVGAGTTVAPAGAPVAYGWHWFGFGFPFFGLIFGLLFLFLIFALIRRAVWGGRGWHGHGYGYGPSYGPGQGGRYGWDGKSVPPFADEMLRNWHSQAHGQSTAGDQPPTTGGQPTQPTDPTQR